MSQQTTDEARHENECPMECGATVMLDGMLVRDADGTPHTCDEPRPTYRERRAAKAERLRGWAASREAKADAAQATARAKADAIPFGQPILVGHHSEGRDRRYRDSITRGFERAHDHATKADEMRARADEIDAQAERAIYSDDPDAIERLEERITALEAERARIKAYNQSCRKGNRDVTLLDERQQRDLIRTAEVCPYQIGKRGEFPGYALSNLSGNINRQRKRLEQLRAEGAR